MKIWKQVGLAALIIGFTSSSWAQTSEDPVLDLLVKKGLVSQQEADTARAQAKEAAAQNPASPAISFINSPGLQNVQFYGDGRLRFENIDQHNHYGAITLTDRERYRLRLGADYFYSQNFKAGVELESATTNDSANQTFGGMFTKASINVGKIYLQYQPVDWLTAIAGKFSNPWYTTTDMVYSFDLNPEGGAEIFNYTIPLGSGSATPVSDPKDVKSAEDSSDSSLTVGLTAIQYLYVDSNEGVVGVPNNDVYIIGEQIPVAWKVNDKLTVKVAPGFTFYTGGGNVDYGSNVPTNGTVTGITPAFYAGTANSSNDPVFYSTREADDLAVFSAPGEFNFTLAGIPFRPYWDFEYNTEARARIQNVFLQTGTVDGYSTGVSAAAAAQNKGLTEGIAWAAGLQIGANKKRGDWSFLGEFRQIGLGSVDPNINGTDYADSYPNQQGFKLAGAYNFTDFLTGTVTFYDTWDYKSNLYQALGGTSASPSNTTATTLYLVGEKASQRVQVDLGWKF